MIHLFFYNILNVEQGIYSRVKEMKLKELSTLSKSSKGFLVSECMIFLLVCIHTSFTECFVYSCSANCDKCFRWWKAIIHNLVLQSFFRVGASWLQFDLKFYHSNFHWHIFYCFCVKIMAFIFVHLNTLYDLYGVMSCSNTCIFQWVTFTNHISLKEIQQQSIYTKNLVVINIR